MLDIQQVTKKYLGVTAVDNVSLSLADGRLGLLLGPNGSGKTTLMKMIAGLARPDKGTITFEGEGIGVSTKKQICYMPTENYFYNFMTVKDVGSYYHDFFPDFDLTKYEEMVVQEDIALKRKVRALSSGMTAKIKLAAAWARDARLTMLDEPLNGVDLIARDRIITLMRTAKENKRGLLVSTHLVDELEPLIDDMYFMSRGQLVLAGTHEELCGKTGKTAAMLYREIYGNEVQENA